MKSIHNIGIFILCFCVFLLSSCVPKNDDPTEEPEYSDRKEMLTHYADEIIIPGYANFKVKLEAMASKSTAFTESPSTTTLTEFRQAWVEAYTEWQKVELFDVGPANFHSLRSYFNIYPANAQGINDNIALSTSPNLEVPAAYPSQGFPALDYLLNGLATTDEDILAYYTSAADASKRKAYINTLITQMNTKFNLVHSGWNSTYRNDFINNTSMGMSGSTSLLVNGYVLNYERFIRSGKIGIPSGAMLGGTPSPTLVEAYYKKDISLSLANAAHQASIDFFNGKSVKTGVDGPSLKTYLNAINAIDFRNDDPTTVEIESDLLADLINVQFNMVETKLNLLSENLSNEVSSNNQAMKDVYSEMQLVVGLLKVDMTSAMSVTITYTDNDGD
jgi:predicted lipoprotein